MAPRPRPTGSASPGSAPCRPARRSACAPAAVPRPPPTTRGAPAPSPPSPAPPRGARVGGPVLDQPRFVPVFFSNDDMTLVPKFVDFNTRLGTSAYWSKTTAEYGVGPATTVPAVVVAETASGTIDDTK